MFMVTCGIRWLSGSRCQERQAERDATRRVQGQDLDVASALMQEQGEIHAQGLQTHALDHERLGGTTVVRAGTHPGLFAGSPAHLEMVGIGDLDPKSVGALEPPLRRRRLTPLDGVEQPNHPIAPDLTKALQSAIGPQNAIDEGVSLRARRVSAAAGKQQQPQQHGPRVDPSHRAYPWVGRQQAGG